MDGLSFLLSNEPDPNCAAGLRQAHVVSADRTVWPARVQIDDRHLTVRRLVCESGAVYVPWLVENFGDIIVHTTSLMERPEPYRFATELARGQLNTVRNQCAEWEQNGLRVPELIRAGIKRAGASLRRAILSTDENDSERYALEALSASLHVGEDLTATYARRAVAARRRNRDSPVVLIDCVVRPDRLSARSQKLYCDAFRHAMISPTWPELELRQGERHWDPLDECVQWCTANGLSCTIGPLIEFRPQALPDWLWLWEGEVSRMIGFMTEHVEQCVRRYAGKVRQWEIAARANSAEILGLNEEQMLGIVARLAETAAQTDPKAQRVLMIDQPWGEYQATEDRTYSPFTFANTLIRTGLPINGLVLEVAMGYAPGGSYCRSLMDVSQMLDAYHEIDVPIQIRLSFPSGPLRGVVSGVSAAGFWHAEPDESVHARWLKRAVAIAMAKPFVYAVTCGCFHDQPKNAWPLSGLLTEDERPKPAYHHIRAICSKYSETDMGARS
jgi:hypothetical protein